MERVADAMGCGQVLDVESGENQTLGADFTEEVLLQRFPKLQVGDGWMMDVGACYGQHGEKLGDLMGS